MKVVYVGVDDRTAMIATLAIHLRWPDVAPKICICAKDGIEAIGEMRPDVILLHPNFDDLTLNKVIQEIRSFNQAPLLVLGQEGSEMEVISALELGADDYVRLPCDPTEIMVRIRALLRRAGNLPFHEKEGPLSSGNLFINPASYRVFLGDERLALTPTEIRLLHLLVKNRGVVVTHQVLAQALWAEQIDSNRLVKKYVQRLRSKLKDNPKEPCWIASIHGVGYLFIGPSSDSEISNSIIGQTE